MAVAAALLTAGACKKDTESLVVVSLTASPADSSLTSVSLSVAGVTQPFPLTAGLSDTAPTTFGVYLPPSAIGRYTVQAVASGGTASYLGTSVPVNVTTGATVTTSIVLTPGTDCATEVGGTGPPGAPPSLALCTEYVHNFDPSAACVTGDPSTDVEITDVAFSPDGKLVYTAGNDSRVKVWTWDGVNGTLTAEGHELQTTGGFTALAVSSDNTLVLAGSQNGGVTAWNVGTTWSIAGTLMGLTADVNGVAFAPGSTNKNFTIYTADADSNLKVYNLTSLSPVSTVVLRTTATPFTLSASPAASDGSYWLAIGYDDGDASLLDVDAQGHVGDEVPFTVSTSVSGVYTSRFSPDGTMLEAGTIDGSFGIWSVPLPSAKAPRAPQIAVGTDSVFGGAFDPTSSYVAITGGLTVCTRKIGIWNVATGAPRATVPTAFYNQRPTAAVFSPNGKTLVVGEHNCGKILVCAD
jgi:WD40 repeat protein